MFNWSNVTDLPKLTDVLDPSDIPMNFMWLFIEAWILFLGGWFFAAVFGAIAAALYIKYDNGMVAVAFFVIMFTLCGGVFLAEPAGALPSAAVFLYIVGLLCTFVVGFVLYQLFVSKKE